MYELRQISEHDYYIDGPTKIGIVQTGENEIVLIDSGYEQDARNIILPLLNEKEWKLKAILNTHCHADHIGGNRYLQQQTGCKVYAPGLDCPCTNSPVLDPMTFFGGLPFDGLQGKFPRASGSECSLLTEDILPEGMEIIELPGHSFDMVGFKTPDGNIFLADSLSSPAVLEKYGIGFMWNAEKYLESLEKVKTLEGNLFIPAHAEVMEDVTVTADFNIRFTRQILKRILILCICPKSFETILHDLLDEYGMRMTVQKYGLIGCTVRSCLSSLHAQGKLEIICSNGYLLWRTL